MNAEVCTFKLLKALCSVLVTTKSESPGKKESKKPLVSSDFYSAHQSHSCPRILESSQNSESVLKTERGGAGRTVII